MMKWAKHWKEAASRYRQEYREMAFIAARIELRANQYLDEIERLKKLLQGGKEG